VEHQALGPETHVVCQALEVAFRVPLGVAPQQEAMAEAWVGEVLLALPSQGVSTASSLAMRR
jgi:hypothetical protein